ncbi:hypothetical protein PInf_019762 [Phytophthora infestans]|nr:hypothetical protein PInf_019762 [Phytophthora infestans]
MTPAGRWQREYERDWRDYARQVIANHFGKYALQCSPAVTQKDERQLREALASVGIKHAPPNHSRWNAPIPASQTFSAPQNSIVSDGSYVYSTPPSPESQSMFPAFSSQDFASQSTPQRRVSASQRLQVRMADVSPIADSRRTSIECAGTISPPSGAAKSPWTPGQWSPKPARKTRRTPRRSLEPSFREDLDVSMHSMHLSDEENERSLEDDAAEVEDTQMIDVSEAHVEEKEAAVIKEVNSEEDKGQVQIVECQEKSVDEQDAAENVMVHHDPDDEEMNVSKELVFSSDSEEDDIEDKAEPEAEAVVEEEKTHGGVPIPPERNRSPPPEDTTERPPWASEPDFEFGDGTEYGDENQQQESEQQDVNMHEPEPPAVEKRHQAESCDSNAINIRFTHCFFGPKNVVRDPHSFVSKKNIQRNSHGFVSAEAIVCYSDSLIRETDHVFSSYSFVSEESATRISCTFGKESNADASYSPTVF